MEMFKMEKAPYQKNRKMTEKNNPKTRLREKQITYQANKKADGHFQNKIKQANQFLNLESLILDNSRIKL